MKSVDSYKEQVNHLKAELKFKNEMINKLTTGCLCMKQNKINAQSSPETSIYL